MSAPIRGTESHERDCEYERRAKSCREWDRERGERECWWSERDVRHAIGSTLGEKRHTMEQIREPLTSVRRVSWRQRHRGRAE
jgi:hypothetical protein